MRRQATTGRATPAGSSRDERLDPFCFPLRFVDADCAADERIRHVELTASAWCCVGALRGIKMAVNLPVAAFLGVAIRMEPAAGRRRVCRLLEHPDPALSLTLCRACEAATSSPTGGPGGERSACRCWSRDPTGVCVNRLHRLGGVARRPPSPAAAGAPP